ncbi:metabolite traffic protein EboE [Actinacidiphila rubida]|uniref:Xylose isomerase-like TIM barrel n=1 Tax=Actinacidiphila rubida TaxID=310780 RepID=A0A1H8R8I9_9ACTN|nr:metabolite traffic protein EboE [Actinacidiphila rubida]SEO62468.1 Xylose isomerase-like TIM barrel [Actinacidiphila rubida]
MRFTHPDGSTLHLAYCTNVHGAETLDAVIAQLGAYCEPVRRHLDTPRLGVGLWLARDAATALAASPAALAHLRGELERRSLEVVTLNGFPYQGFGAASVKYRVYRPDWTEPARLDYTLDLARILAALLPDDVGEGTISTLPLGWHTAVDATARHTCRTALTTLAGSLDQLQQDTGRSVRIAVEPEPGCAVETTADAVDALADLPAHRIGVCLDTCHLATAFEEPAAALARLHTAGIDVVKAQLSAALHAPTPADPAVRTALAAFDEPRFLHQTRARHGTLLHASDDLGPALNGTALPDDVPWRSHFHVPLHAPPAPPLTSTTAVLKDALAELAGGRHPRCHHLEVETYTWQALPPALRPADDAALAAGIAAELALARDWLTDLGCKEQQP